MGCLCRFGYVIGLDVVFFFSSRRRHTRLQGDWSSDVCSSDLLLVALSRIVFIFDNQHAVLPLHHLGGPHRRTSLFTHGFQPLFGMLLMNGLPTDRKSVV